MTSFLSHCFAQISPEKFQFPLCALALKASKTHTRVGRKALVSMENIEMKHIWKNNQTSADRISLTGYSKCVLFYCWRSVSLSLFFPISKGNFPSKLMQNVWKPNAMVDFSNFDFQKVRKGVKRYYQKSYFRKCLTERGKMRATSHTLTEVWCLCLHQ